MLIENEIIQYFPTTSGGGAAAGVDSTARVDAREYFEFAADGFNGKLLLLIRQRDLNFQQATSRDGVCFGFVVVFLQKIIKTGPLMFLEWIKFEELLLPRSVHIVETKSLVYRDESMTLMPENDYVQVVREIESSSQSSEEFDFIINNTIQDKYGITRDQFRTNRQESLKEIRSKMENTFFSSSRQLAYTPFKPIYTQHLKCSFSNLWKEIIKKVTIKEQRLIDAKHITLEVSTVFAAIILDKRHAIGIGYQRDKLYFIDANSGIFCFKENQDFMEDGVEKRYKGFEHFKAFMEAIEPNYLEFKSTISHNYEVAIDYFYSHTFIEE